MCVVLEMYVRFARWLSRVWLAVCCSVSQCVSVRCNALQCVAACCSAFNDILLDVVCMLSRKGMHILLDGSCMFA